MSTPKALEAPYTCPICGTHDTSGYLRCNRPDCPDGRDPRPHSLASQPAESEASYSAIRNDALADAARVADEMTAKWGNPIGSIYEQGVHGQSVRIAGRIRSHILNVQPAEPEGMETTEDRRKWMERWVVHNGSLPGEDALKLLRDFWRIEGREQVSRDFAAESEARAEKAEAEVAALKQPVESGAVDHSIATLMRYAVKMEAFVGDEVPNELRASAMLLGKVDQERARQARQIEEMREASGFADLRSANVARQAEWDTGNQITLTFRSTELAGETGEACNVIKKIERERMGIRGSRATLTDLADELADVVICVDLIAMTEGIDLGAAVERKFNATSEKVGLATRFRAALSADQVGAK